MNREIKFRAWDLDAKDKMYSWEEIRRNFFEHYIHARIALMQFTGLQDKNGKDIYEGDILKWSVSPMYGTSRVLFYDGAFRLADYVSEENHLNEAFCSKQTEVIGNIHQNPDLQQ